MTDFNQFGSAKPGQTVDPKHCAQCEAMLTDALDGTLSEKDQTFFDLHMAECPICGAMLADAKRGAAWLEMLRFPRPEPPVDLVSRILAQTAGLQTADALHASGTAPRAVDPAAMPSAAPRILQPNTLLTYGPRTASPSTLPATAKVLPFRSRMAATLKPLGHTLLQPRLAMTAAMAFFSIALTLNLTGVRLNQLRASDLKPSSLRRSLSQANAHVVRYYDSLRVVYELESRVHDLQRSSDSEEETPAAQPGTQPAAPATSDPTTPGSGQQAPAGQQDPSGTQKQPRPKPGPGSSLKQDPAAGFRFTLASRRSPSFPCISPEATMLLPRSLDVKQEGDQA